MRKKIDTHLNGSLISSDVGVVLEADSAVDGEGCHFSALVEQNGAAALVDALADADGARGGHFHRRPNSENHGAQLQTVDANVQNTPTTQLPHPRSKISLFYK